MSNLQPILDSMTIPGELFETLPNSEIRCYACGHRCLIREGKRGICHVRFNNAGKLFVPWGYVAGLQVDPIEKKPFFHILPGEEALTFGMLGCNFHCTYCQNWVTSQTLRDNYADYSANHFKRISAEQIVKIGVHNNVGLIASSYNEPLITTEWAEAIFQIALASGIKCVYVSNGYATPEGLRHLQPFLTGLKIDLKTMQAQNYRHFGGVLTTVLDCIQTAHNLGIWVEIVTLVVPGFNDNTSELMDTARFIRSVSQDIPWHVTAFHPDYKMTDPPPTSTKTLLRAAEIGQEAGLNYVYAGNLPGRVNEYENTFCPNCQTPLIQRHSYRITDYRISAQGTCPKCNFKIAGVWTNNPDKVHIGGIGIPRLMVR